MRWAQRYRVAFIGGCLLSKGAVNRSDLVRKFGISVPQASVDLRLFDRVDPGAMKYDKSRKAYVPDKLTRDGRDTTAAADKLMRVDDAELEMILHHDPSMIRDVAAALLYERNSLIALTGEEKQ